MFDYVIIGGGIAGVAAAETIRAHDHEGSIALISREPLPLYSRVMLPWYVRGKLNREQVFLRNVADYEKKGITLFLDHEAAGVNLERHEVHTNTGRIFSYRALLISTGGMPARWRAEGGEHPLVHRLQTIEDADRLRNTLETLNPQSNVLVIGCGFIGLEFIESCIAYGARPLIIMPEAYAFERFMGPEGGRLLEEQWQRKGAAIMHHTTIAALRSSEAGPPAARLPDEQGRAGIVALTTEGQAYHGAFAGVGIGIERNIGMLTGIGLEVKEGVMTNEFLETNNPGVFAAGDVAEYLDPILHKYLINGNWTSAYLQGSIVGENMARFLQGERADYRAFRKVPSYSLTHMGMHLAFLGACEKNARFADESRRAARLEEQYDPLKRTYQQLFFDGARLVGASLINHPKDIPALIRRIETAYE